MTVGEAIHKRRSIRRYTGAAITEEQLETLMRAAMAAPSACDTRAWEFVVVRKKEQLEALSKVHKFAGPIARCGAAIAICGIPEKQDHICPGFWPQDCAAVAMNLLLSATELGLGSLWVGIHPFNESVVNSAEVLKTPEGVVPFAVICVGTSEQQPEPRDRFEPDRIHFEEW